MKPYFLLISIIVISSSPQIFASENLALSPSIEGDLEAVQDLENLLNDHQIIELTENNLEYHIGVVTPDPSIDYKILNAEIDPDIEYKLHIQ